VGDMRKILIFVLSVLSVFGIVYLTDISIKHFNQTKILKQVIKRLEADSRIAEVLVSGVEYDEVTGKKFTTIKFLEYDTDGNPLEPLYFTFPGNIIQFQSLVIRFDDIHVRNKDLMKGKSAYLFWKVFLLDGNDTIEYSLSELEEIPKGYKISGGDNDFERALWEKFWQYALNPASSEEIGVKNAQIEAPGTMFVPGTIYTIKIEHDGGIRIDASPLPEIIRGEKIG
jgi:hypothetical protein